MTSEPDAPPYPSLADFAATWSGREAGALPPWLHPAPSPLAPLEVAGLLPRIEDLLDTVVALQRGDWLSDGIYLGPRALSETWDALLVAARRLQVAVPPAVVSGCAPRAQGVFGTDARAFLHLSSFALYRACAEERRFMVGRLCGHLAARQVSPLTLYAVLVDAGGLRTVARRALGPALELLLAPLSLGVRLALSRWRRAAELNADRAGLLCAGSVEGAERALLRIALGLRPDFSPEAYQERLRILSEPGSPARYAELLAGRPWTHKRMKALEIFARSEAYAAAGGEAGPEPLLDDLALAQETERLLEVG